jgi:hypothetical protein
LTAASVPATPRSQVFVSVSAVQSELCTQHLSRLCRRVRRSASASASGRCGSVGSPVKTTAGPQLPPRSGFGSTGLGETATARPGTATPEEARTLLHMPRSRPAACARNQQLIGKNRQLMSFSGSSATRASLHVHEAEVASLFSEATARCWNHELGRRRRGPFEAGVPSRTQVSKLALPSSRTVALSLTLAGHVYGTGGATTTQNNEASIRSFPQTRRG